jgi:uncharacterized membrane protein
MAVGIVWGCEFIYLKDFLSGGGMRRMNTVFKFYNQAWILFGISSIGLFYFVVQKRKEGRLEELKDQAQLDEVLAVREDDSLINNICIKDSDKSDSSPALLPSPIRKLYLDFSFLLFLGAFTYVIFAVPVRLEDRFDNSYDKLTLDGMAYMQEAKYFWPDPSSEIEMKYDSDAITWLNNNVVGLPVIVEGPPVYYREHGSRVSVFTGFPTLTGFHQGEQKYPDLVGERDGDLRTIFEARQLEKIIPLLNKYDVRYIYVGQLERAAYPEDSLAKFNDKSPYLELVYENEKTQIYLVKKN